MVIRSIMASMLEDFELVLLQPEITALSSDFGSRGGGWRGVMRWCQEVGTRGGPNGDPAFANSNLVIIHVDADVSDEINFDCRHRPTSGTRPNKQTIAAIQGRLVAFLGGRHGNLVFCIPHNATEAWLLPLFHPEIEEPEAMLKPATLFVGGKPKLCRYKEGSLQKVTSRYESILRAITDGWHLTTACCPEANIFEADIRNHLETQNAV
jgi:hypothetical protein